MWSSGELSVGAIDRPSYVFGSLRNHGLILYCIFGLLSNRGCVFAFCFAGFALGGAADLTGGHATPISRVKAKHGRNVCKRLNLRGQNFVRAL